MIRETRWQVLDMACPEKACPGNRLLLEWQEVQGAWTLCGVSCDNPRLKDLDNWECNWACWEEVAEQAQRRLNLA
jgi:hypothetical protein